MKKRCYIIFILLIIAIISICYVNAKMKKYTEKIGKISDAKIIYYYIENKKEESKTLELELSTSEIKHLEIMLKKYKFKDFSKSGLALEIKKETNVKYILIINDKIKLMFQPKEKEAEEFIIISYEDKEYLTLVPKEISEYIYNIIDIKLQENIKMYKTDKITIKNRDLKEIILIDSKEIDKFIEYCKDIYNIEEIKEITKDYIIDFNNGNILYIDKEYNTILYNRKYETKTNVKVPYNIIYYLEKIKV